MIIIKIKLTKNYCTLILRLKTNSEFKQYRKLNTYFEKMNSKVGSENMFLGILYSELVYSLRMSQA